MKLRQKVMVIGILLGSTILMSCGKITTTNQEVTSKQDTQVKESVTEIPRERELANSTVKPTKEPKPSPTPTLEPTQESPEIVDTRSMEIPDVSWGYYYDQLTREQKSMYLWILWNKKTITEKEIGFSNIKEEDFQRVILAIDLDNSYYRVKQYYGTPTDEAYFLKIIWEQEIEMEQEDWAEQVASEILKEIDGKTQEEMMIQIYDWCTQNIMYDMQEPNCRNLYGAFIRNRCVCTGFAKAFEYLCMQKGIQVICVSNKSHMWNYVKLDDCWYAVDTTNGKCGATDFLLQGKEILSVPELVPNTEYFSLPELAEISYYPPQEIGEEIKHSLQSNKNSFETQMKEIEEYGEENSYDEIHQLLGQAVGLTDEMLEKINDSHFYHYINTEEFDVKNEELGSLIEEIANFDW